MRTRPSPDAGPGSVDFNASEPGIISTWLVRSFLPTWARILTPPGYVGFPEQVDASGSPIDSSERSTMVTARLIYTLCLCHELDPAGPYLDAARHGYAFLLQGRPGTDGRFSHVLYTDSRGSEQPADLYDSAFVLMALAAYAKVSGELAPLEIAREVGRQIDRRYLERDASDGLQRQFPHMHLFEACELLARLQPDAGWTGRAGFILDLLEQKLILPNGAIAELYDQSWSVAQESHVIQIEIGHQFEWAWLLYRHSMLTGSQPARTIADGLYSFGIRGVSWANGELQPFRNCVNQYGKAMSEDRPLWPMTELLRASHFRDRLTGGTSGTSDAVVRSLFKHYLDHDNSTWVNDLADKGSGTLRPIPTRVLYHIIPALASYCQAKEAVFGDCFLLGLG